MFYFDGETGSELCGEVQHYRHPDGEHWGWRWPVPSLPALYTCLSRCSCLHKPLLHCERHRGEPGNFVLLVALKEAATSLNQSRAFIFCSGCVSGGGSAVFSWSNQSRGWRQRTQHSSDLHHPVWSDFNYTVVMTTAATNYIWTFCSCSWRNSTSQHRLHTELQSLHHFLFRLCSTSFCNSEHLFF